MEGLLISIHPEWVAKILNGEKTDEIRRNAPKEWMDYIKGRTDMKPEPCEVYIYCTEPHAKYVLSLFVEEVRTYVGGRAAEFVERKRVDNPNMRWSICNGRVAAKFMLNDVYVIHDFLEGLEATEPTNRHVTIYDENELLKASCLSKQQIEDYGGIYDWHISDLTIFDEPKELSEFKHNTKPCRDCVVNHLGIKGRGTCAGCDKTPTPLEKAPQSWCRVEMERQ